MRRASRPGIVRVACCVHSFTSPRSISRTSIPGTGHGPFRVGMRLPPVLGREAGSQRPLLTASRCDMGSSVRWRRIGAVELPAAQALSDPHLGPDEFVSAGVRADVIPGAPHMVVLACAAAGWLPALYSPAAPAASGPCLVAKEDARFQAPRGNIQAPGGPVVAFLPRAATGTARAPFPGVALWSRRPAPPAHAPIPGMKPQRTQETHR